MVGFTINSILRPIIADEVSSYYYLSDKPEYMVQFAKKSDEEIPVKKLKDEILKDALTAMTYRSYVNVGMRRNVPVTFSIDDIL